MLSPFHTVAFQKLHQIFVRLGADQALLVQDECGHGPDPEINGALPVCIYGSPERSGLKNLPRFFAGEADRSSQICKDRHARNVPAVYKISAENRRMDPVTRIPRLRPQAQFLRKTRVIKHARAVERQTGVRRRFFQSLCRCLDIDIPACKEAFQRNPRLRRFRMQRKCPPPHRDFINALQFLNTPGNEIAPRSSVIGKNFKNRFVRHPPALPFCLY